MFADTELVILPLEFDDAEPPAFQFHDAKVALLSFQPAPKLKPFESKDEILSLVASAFVLFDLINFVVPLTVSNIP